MSPIINPSGGGGGGSQVILSATRTVTSAELLNMAASLPVLITAPGAGKVLSVVRHVTIGRLSGKVPYSVAGDLAIFYQGATAQVNSCSRVWSECLTSAVDTITNDSEDTPKPPVATAVNTALVLSLLVPNPQSGPVKTATVQSGGAGYAPGDTFAITGGGSGTAIGHVTSVAAGAVTAFTITARGTGYDTGSNPLTTTKQSGGGDDALTVNVTAFVTYPVDGTADLEMTLFYSLISV